MAKSCPDALKSAVFNMETPLRDLERWALIVRRLGAGEEISQEVFWTIGSAMAACVAETTSLWDTAFKEVGGCD